MKKRKSTTEPLPEQSAPPEAEDQAPAPPKTKIEIGDFILKCPICRKPIFGHFHAIVMRQLQIEETKKPGEPPRNDADTIDLECSCGLRFHGWIYI